MAHKHIKSQITIKDIFQDDVSNDYDRRHLVISYANYLCGKHLVYTLAEGCVPFQDLLPAFDREAFSFCVWGSTYTWFPPPIPTAQAGGSLTVDTGIAQGSVCSCLSLSYFSFVPAPTSCGSSSPGIKLMLQQQPKTQQWQSRIYHRLSHQGTPSSPFLSQFTL